MWKSIIYHPTIEQGWQREFILMSMIMMGQLEVYYFYFDILSVINP